MVQGRALAKANGTGQRVLVREQEFNVYNQKRETQIEYTRNDEIFEGREEQKIGNITRRDRSPWYMSPIPNTLGPLYEM